MARIKEASLGRKKVGFAGGLDDLIDGMNQRRTWEEDLGKQREPSKEKKNKPVRWEWVVEA